MFCIGENYRINISLITKRLVQAFGYSCWKVIFSTTGPYDSFNPIILKGTAADGLENLYETLTTNSNDEAFTDYGLIAESIEWPDDRSWVTFKIRNEAIWHDGNKI